MEQSINLSLPYVMGQQSQKHVTVNESLRRLDAVVQASATSRGQSLAPNDPAEGDRYIMPGTIEEASPPWSGFLQHSIAAFQDSAWSEIIPQEGWRIFVSDENALLVFHQGAWSSISAGMAGTENDMANQFGVNTSADDINRLSVKSDAVLFSHDDVTPGSGDLRHVFNKAQSSNSASLLFQTGFVGSVELGLLGNDDLTLQVSADGQTFKPAMRIDHTSAMVSIGELMVNPAFGSSELYFSTGGQSPFWAIGQGINNSFYLTRLSGGFGTGGRVITYDSDGNLGLWGEPSTDGRIAVVSNINTDGADNILYLRQTAFSPASGIVQFHNDQDNTTPILRCTTNARTVLNVPAKGSVSLGSPLQLLNVTRNNLPSANTSGSGAMIFVSDAIGGAIPAFSDGSNWRQVTDRAIIG